MFGTVKRFFNFKNTVRIFSTLGLYSIAKTKPEGINTMDIEIALLSTRDQFPTIPSLNILNDLYKLEDPSWKNMEKNLAVKDALAPHVHAVLMDPCSIQTNDDPKEKDISDQREFFHAAAEVYCPLYLGMVPVSCRQDREERITAQWKELVQQSRTPSTLGPKKCLPTAVSQVYTQQFQDRVRKKPKMQLIDTNTKDNISLGVAVAGGIAVGSAAEKLRKKIREMQENRRRRS